MHGVEKGRAPCLPRTQVMGHWEAGGLALTVLAKAVPWLCFFDSGAAPESSLAWKLGELVAGAASVLTSYVPLDGSPGPQFSLL